MRRAIGFRDPDKEVQAYLDKFSKIQQSYMSDVQFDAQLENLKMNIKSEESLRALQGGVTSILGRMDARGEFLSLFLLRTRLRANLLSIRGERTHP